ncbi:hypothetical protein NIES1031_17775 [Chroogloeocystis siderophila 5.2 s.c.1]|uniref:Uncharacterized protein n=1 Tax=Chroogloeocystis siderophila 5.2 s.c.1 TaxID=247279 RepID=A0A1U7HJB2_9CHRO|nr:hypothetical protein [Chroogloeocystis siderophila]OKH23680.1 hypothetical protein NIES1031_17775 [Chroogloeocystis siderophila 5.2 s.c.1]
MNELKQSPPPAIALTIMLATVVDCGAFVKPGDSCRGLISKVHEGGLMKFRAKQTSEDGFVSVAAFPSN